MSEKIKVPDEVEATLFPSSRKRRRVVRHEIRHLIATSLMPGKEKLAYNNFAETRLLLSLSGKQSSDIVDSIFAWCLAHPTLAREFIMYSLTWRINKDPGGGQVLGCLKGAHAVGEEIFLIDQLKRNWQHRLFADVPVSSEIMGDLSQACDDLIGSVWSYQAAKFVCRRKALAEFFQVVDSDHTTADLGFIQNFHDALINEFAAKLFLAAPPGRRAMIMKHGLCYAVRMSLPIGI